MDINGNNKKGKLKLLEARSSNITILEEYIVCTTYVDTFYCTFYLGQWSLASTLLDRERLFWRHQGTSILHKTDTVFTPHLTFGFSAKIRQSTIYYAELLGRWDKRIIDQESDVPSIIIFYTFYRLRALKTLYFYFCNFIEKIRK